MSFSQSAIEKIINCSIESMQSLAGGCIAKAQKITTKNGDMFFAKAYSGENAEQIAETEAAGLILLSKHLNGFFVPVPIGQENNLLVLPWISQSSKPEYFYSEFGALLARNHRDSKANRFGWDRKNFIGSNAQLNEWSEDWASFWWTKRLMPQLERTQTYFSQSEFKTITTSLPERIRHILGDTILESPVAMHGDLWGGNHLCTGKGEIALIDPAFYFGHREAELAMTKMFRSYPGSFYEAYESIYPLQPNYWEKRYPVYLVYHQLNHLSLFGSSYLDGVLSSLKLILS